MTEGEPWTDPPSEEIEKLSEILAAHFTDAPKSRLDETAEELSILRSLAHGTQYVENANTTSLKDYEALQKAIKNLSRAEDKIRGLGRWGGEIIVNLAKELNAFEGDLFPDLQPSTLQSREIVSNRIGEIKGALETALFLVDAEDLKLGHKRGPREKIGAKTLVKGLYKIFARETGTKPTYDTNRVTNEITGRFPGFVRAIFDFYGVDASAESMVKFVCREKNPPKS